MSESNKNGADLFRDHSILGVVKGERLVREVSGIDNWKVGAERVEKMYSPVRIP